MPPPSGLESSDESRAEGVPTTHSPLVGRSEGTAHALSTSGAADTTTPPATGRTPDTSNTRMLLRSLEDLRDSLSVRVDQLSLAIDRLRGQANELERAVSSGSSLAPGFGRPSPFSSFEPLPRPDFTPPPPRREFVTNMTDSDPRVARFLRANPEFQQTTRYDGPRLASDSRDTSRRRGPSPPPIPRPPRRVGLAPTNLDAVGNQPAPVVVRSAPRTETDPTDQTDEADQSPQHGDRSVQPDALAPPEPNAASPPSASSLIAPMSFLDLVVYGPGATRPAFAETPPFRAPRTPIPHGIPAGSRSGANNPSFWEDFHRLSTERRTRANDMPPDMTLVGMRVMQRLQPNAAAAQPASESRPNQPAPPPAPVTTTPGTTTGWGNHPYMPGLPALRPVLGPLPPGSETREAIDREIQNANRRLEVVRRLFQLYNAGRRPRYVTGQEMERDTLVQAHADNSRQLWTLVHRRTELYGPSPLPSALRQWLINNPHMPALLRRGMTAPTAHHAWLLDENLALQASGEVSPRTAVPAPAAPAAVQPPPQPRDFTQRTVDGETYPTAPRITHIELPPAASPLPGTPLLRGTSTSAPVSNPRTLSELTPSGPTPLSTSTLPELESSTAPGSLANPLAEPEPSSAPAANLPEPDASSALDPPTAPEPSSELDPGSEPPSSGINNSDSQPPEDLASFARRRAQQLTHGLAAEILASDEPRTRRILNGIEDMMATPELSVRVRNRLELLADRERRLLQDMLSTPELTSGGEPEGPPPAPPPPPTVTDPIMERIERSRARIRDLSRVYDELQAARATLDLGPRDTPDLGSRDTPLSRRGSDAETVVPQTFSVDDVVVMDDASPPIPAPPARLQVALSVPIVGPSAANNAPNAVPMEPLPSSSSASSSTSNRATLSHAHDPSPPADRKETGELSAEDWPQPQRRREPRPYVSILDL